MSIVRIVNVSRECYRKRRRSCSHQSPVELSLGIIMLPRGRRFHSISDDHLIEGRIAPFSDRTGESAAHRSSLMDGPVYAEVKRARGFAKAPFVPFWFPLSFLFLFFLFSACWCACRRFNLPLPLKVMKRWGCT